MARVILLSPDDRSGLAVCRSLGAAGHVVTHLRFERRRGIADFSKYCSASHFLGNPEIDLDGAGAGLAEHLRGQDFLIPMNDRACELAYHALGSDLSKLIGPPRDTYFEAKDKAGILKTLGGLLRAPETILVSSPADAADARFPCFAKPVFSCAIVDGVMRTTNVRIVRNAEDVEKRLRDVDPIPLMLQQPVRGQGVGINFAAFEGRLLGVSVTERLHEPGFGGGSSYRRSGEVTEEILDIARSVAEKFRWTGFMMVECKRSDDGFYLMELNCRPWGSIGLSIFAGADYPRLLVNAFEGRFGDLKVARAGAYSRHLKKDFGWALRHPAKFLSWAAGLRHALLGAEQWDVERIGDLRPALAQLRPARILDRLRIGKADASPDAAPRDVVFVCKGNINRSAVAADFARSIGVRADSAALLPRQGRRISAPAERYLHGLGVGSEAHRTKALEQALKPGTSLIVFEKRHIAEVRQRAPGYPVYMLSELGRETGDIADPEGGDPETYNRTFHRIVELVRKIYG